MNDLRVGVVGLGGMGWAHIAGWRALGAEIFGFDQIDEVRATAVEGLGAGQVTDDLSALFARVDVIDVCTPTDMHATVTLAAADSGLPVICEKPLARTLAEADQVITTCRERGVQLHVAQVVRFFAEYAAAQAAVKAGRVGTPAVLRLSREGGAPTLDKWYHDSVRSAGIIGDLMIHDIDYARWIAGPVSRVYARTMRPMGPYDSPTHAYAVLTHASGAISHLTSSWAHEGVPWRTSFEIAGSEGVLSYQLDGRKVLRTSPPELMRHAGATNVETPWTTELREFAGAIRGGQQPRVTAADGRAALAIALAALESNDKGMAVEVADR